MKDAAHNPQIRYHSASINPAIRKLHPELDRAAYIIVDKPKDKMIALEVGESLILADYQMRMTVIGIGHGPSREQSYIDLEVNYSERDHYPGAWQNPSGSCCYVPNPRSYAPSEHVDLLPLAERVYRTHRYCTGELNRAVWNEGLAVIELSGGYRNYIGRSRFYEQCLLDGSFDTYYEEHCDFGTLRLFPGIIYSFPEFDIRLDRQDDHVKMEMSDRGNHQYRPLYYEPLALTSDGDKPWEQLSFNFTLDDGKTTDNIKP